MASRSVSFPRMDAIAFHSGGSSARSQKISNPRDRRSLFTEPFWRQQNQEQEQQQQQQQQQEQQQAWYDRDQQRLEERRHEQEDQGQRDLYQQHLESTAEKLRKELEEMLVADVDRDATFQLKLTRKLDQWHAFHERATRGGPGSVDDGVPSTDHPGNVHPLEVDQSADATCPSERAASAHEAEMRTAEAEARAAEGEARATEIVVQAAKGEARAASDESWAAKGEARAASDESWAAKGEARAASGESWAAKGEVQAGAAARKDYAGRSSGRVAPVWGSIVQAGAAALETRGAKAAEPDNAAVAPKQLEAAADAQRAALEAALQVQPEELEAKAVVIQELETREAKAVEPENAAVVPKQLDAAADARRAALEAALQLQREEVEAKAVVIQELQVRLHAAATREAGLEANLKLQREELEAKAAEAMAARAAEAAELQQQLDAAVAREAAFGASLKLQREELEAKVAEFQNLQERLQEAGIREAAFDASLKLQREELEAKAAEALAAQAGMEERRRDADGFLGASKFIPLCCAVFQDADEALRLEREAERIRQLECQLADKGKALGQSECERVVLERQLADKAIQLGQSEWRRAQLEQQLEERSREVREARMQLARLQARPEPAGQARQMDLRGEGGVVRAEEKQERQGMSQKEAVPDVAPGSAPGTLPGSATGTVPGVLPDLLRQVLEAAHRPIITRHPMCMHAGMVASIQPMADGDASHADVASHHASGAGTGAEITAASASDAADAAAALFANARAADGSQAAAAPASSTSPVQSITEKAPQELTQELAREAKGAGEQREMAGWQETGVAETGRECEVAALVEANGRLQAERARAEEEKARAEERSARAGEEIRVLQGNLQEAEALCWQRQAQLEEALSEVAAGRRERGALEEELLRLQCALDQCMLRLNSDSAYMVDRRIVVKLLVAYFQRNRSREVLDIMCRILECSKDERQQLEAAAFHPSLTRSASFKFKGSARQGSSKGSRGGVFGLPGRIAGGFLGSNKSSSENFGETGKDSVGQEEVEKKSEARKSGSLTDLWVDFLVKETDSERERRQGQQQQQQMQQEGSNIRTKLAAQVPISPTAAHVPPAAGKAHQLVLLFPKVSPLPTTTIPIISA
ncbi:unnamed protein product [Closterium sp. Yama58-4]|nr:unnamed protein product [Closterium sp. Yama58-4]